MTMVYLLLLIWSGVVVGEGNESFATPDTTVANIEAAESPFTSEELWRQYTQNPNDHPHIPNVSYAGYQRSELPLPRPDVVANVHDYGAKGDGRADDTEAFQAAIAAAGRKGGGTIKIPAGTYRLTDLLHLYHNHVVLRGVRQDDTVLLFDASLTDAIGEHRSSSGHASAWSWMGGMIWIGPEDTFDEQGLPTGPESWRDRRTLANITQPASRGDTTITVDDTSGLAAGDLVIMAWKNSDDRSLLLEMAGHPLMHEFDWDGSGQSLLNQSDWLWPVEITAVDENRVTLAQPLRIDIRDQWKVRIESPGLHVRGVGVERLTIAFDTPRPVEQHLEDVGNNAIYMNRAVDCFVRDVTIRDAENGLIHAAAKQTTSLNIRLAGSRMHHATALRVSSHDNLISDFTIESEVHHGINTEALSTGNVWRHGTMYHGTFDSHRAMSWDLVRTNIKVHNDGSPGGGSQAGPLHGRRVVHWNIQITNGNPAWIHQPEAISMGALVGIQSAPISHEPAWAMPEGDKGAILADPGNIPDPPDLFEAQYRYRTSRNLDLE